MIRERDIHTSSEQNESGRRWPKRLLVALCAFAVTACGVEQDWGNYRADLPSLMVRNGTPAQTWMKEHPNDADIQPIAEQSTALWLHGDGDFVFSSLRDNVLQAQTEHRTPVIVLYNIPYRDCGNFSQGGAKNLDQYRSWIDRIASTIGDTPLITVVEPDALLLTDSEQCVKAFSNSPHKRSERLAALQYAIQQLNTSNNNVYIDAGHAVWKTPFEVAQLLKEVGIDSADGIALNTANHYSTEMNFDRAKEISSALHHSLRIVVDTSRNGVSHTSYNGNWCNAPGRSLGDEPTLTSIEEDNVTLDAMLWVKYPGKSDGICDGGMDAGLWDVKLARELVRNRI